MLKPNDAMVRVVSLAPYKFLPANNGGQRNIAFFYKYLGKYVSLKSYTVKGNENSLAENYESVGFFSTSSFRYVNPFYLFLLYKQLMRDKATHLMIEHPYLGWLAMILKKLCSVKVIIHSHNIESHRFRVLGKWWWSLLWHYEKFTHQLADFNLFITDEDLDYAIKHFQLNPKKCIVATYGIELNAPPPDKERKTAKKILRNKHHLREDEKILLFVGSFNYKPNREAFIAIRDHISPLFRAQNIPYKILVCGPYLSPNDSSDLNVIITGFVDDISLYFKGADVFINPVVEGGGIKTKLVEALGYNLNVVTTKQGALGIAPQICNGKLFLSEEGQWTDFINNLKNCFLVNSSISEEFYQSFFWGAIIQRTVKFIREDA